MSPSATTANMQVSEQHMKAITNAYGKINGSQFATKSKSKLL
jgi:hypothetical protein